MLAKRPSLVLSLVALLTVPVGGANAQCTNGSHYPNGIIAPGPAGQITTITDCNWQIEYGEIGPIVAGANYQFTIADGSFITVHQGTFNGPVLGYGYSPVTVTAATSGDLFPHWSVDSLCNTAQNCLGTIVEFLPDCLPPTVTYTTENDCVNHQFSVFVLVSDTGDASTLSFAYTVDGGNLVVQSNIGLGYHNLGPFALGSIVDLTVVHGDNSQCNVTLNNITGGICAIQSCGPDNYTHCYGNNESYVQTYQGTSSDPLELHFNSGGISATGNDLLVIHDGLTEASPVLFTGVGNAGDLTGVTVLSTNPDHALTITMESNASFSCADGGIAAEWDYVVGCLSCSPPVATAGQVTTDCGAGTYSVNVQITGMGSSSNVTIANNVGVPATIVSSVGSYAAGPFPVGTPVTITLQSDQNSLCDLALGSFENTFCAEQVVCGTQPLAQAYCYQNLDHHTWLYTNTSSQPLALVFSSGSIEQVAYDHLVIYDGVDNTAPVLYQHTSGNTENLSGLTVVSGGSSLYMEMSSDGSYSCEDGGAGVTEWFWSVGCLDCTNPSATFEVIPDCAHHSYTVDVNVSSLGTAPDLRITNNLSTDTIEGVGLGSTIVGPFPAGVAAQIGVLNSSNTLCRIHSADLGYQADECIVTACEPVTVQYCYGNADTVWFIYHSGSGYPITINFNSGELLSNDNVVLYNGPDTTAQLVFSGNLGGQIGGLVLTSNNPQNAITLLVTSDATGSCTSGETTSPLNWTVSCGLVGIQGSEQARPLVYPDPTSTELNVSWPASIGGNVLLEIFDVTGRRVMTERSMALGASVRKFDVSGLGSGNYAVRFSTPSRSWTQQVRIVR